MSATPFVNFYTSDFLAGTSGMTAATKGVYITILCLIYETEAPISYSTDTLARRCGCTVPALKKAIAALQNDGKIVVHDGMIWSDKCAKHITLRRERQNSAKAAAEKRWQKVKPNQRNSDASAMQAQCYPKPEPESDSTMLLNARARTSVQGLSEVLCEAAGVTDETKTPGLLVLSEPLRWLDAGCNLELDILPTIRSIAARGKVPGSWTYYSQAVFQAKANRLAPAPVVTATSPPQRRDKPMSVSEIAMRKAVQ